MHPPELRAPSALLKHGWLQLPLKPKIEYETLACTGMTYLYFYKIDGFHNPWLSRKNTSEQATSHGRNNLSTTTMNGISVESYIVDIKSNSTHIFFTKNTLKKQIVETSLTSTQYTRDILP